jgi:bis(5'-nucleosidyl)-tetraphosphatase
MPSEHSAGAVIFRKEAEVIYYLLLEYPGLRHPKPYWDLPKGHLEPGETEGKTVRREVEEETGITDVAFIKGFRESIKYFFKWEGKTVFKTVAFYLVETQIKEVKISKEHTGFIWLPHKEALAQLSFKNAKNVLQKANDFLSGKSESSGQADS